jgi:hypothetical protein
MLLIALTGLITETYCSLIIKEKRKRYLHDASSDTDTNI